MIRRTFLLGDEWLYYKIYSGVRTADLLLEDFIADISGTLLEKKLIESWFFIRYADPDPHLRVRFKLKDIAQIGQVISLFNELARPYVEENLIWSLKTDSYIRELERYGSNTMELSEDIFFYESEFIIKTLTLIKDDELYFLCIIRAIDDFMTLFEFDATEKLRIYKENSATYKNEFNVGRPTKLSLDKKYRASKEKLDAVMGNLFEDQRYQQVLLELNKRNQRIKPLINILLKHNKTGALEAKLDAILQSYVHMFVNRSFTDRQRFYEMIGYDILVRYQNSKIQKKSF